MTTDRRGAGLGDVVESALASVGVTPGRVEKWLGRPCGCAERRDKLNAIGNWARRVAAGKVGRAAEYLDRIMG